MASRLQNLSSLQALLVRMPGPRIPPRPQFAINYTAANPAELDHVDTAQILAFSLVMLNVDAHNDSIKKVSRSEMRSLHKSFSCPFLYMARYPTFHSKGTWRLTRLVIGVTRMLIGRTAIPYRVHACL